MSRMTLPKSTHTYSSKAATDQDNMSAWEDGNGPHDNSWVMEEDLHTNPLIERFQASKSSATIDGVQNTEGGAQAGRGRWKLPLPTSPTFQEFQMEMGCTLCLINISLPSSS